MDRDIRLALSKEIDRLLDEVLGKDYRTQKVPYDILKTLKDLVDSDKDLQSCASSLIDVIQRLYLRNPIRRSGDMVRDANHLLKRLKSELKEERLYSFPVALVTSIIQNLNTDNWFGLVSEVMIIVAQNWIGGEEDLYSTLYLIPSDVYLRKKESATTSQGPAITPAQTQTQPAVSQSKQFSSEALTNVLKSFRLNLETVVKARQEITERIKLAHSEAELVALQVKLKKLEDAYENLSEYWKAVVEKGYNKN